MASSAPLNTVADLRRALARLLGFDPGGDAGEEFDSEFGETFYFLLTHGIWNAQTWFLTETPYRGWKATATDGDSSGFAIAAADASDGTRTVTMPTDLLRLAGDAKRSAFRKADGSRWGQLLPEPTDAWGNYYWWDGDDILIAKGATVPTGLQLEYHQEHDALEENTTVVFPLKDRPLIVGEAAVLALNEAWVPIDDDRIAQAVTGHVSLARRNALRRSRRDFRPSSFRRYPNRIPGALW